MKIAIITDQHFGARKGAAYVNNYFQKFYDDVFFPYLKKHKIDTVINMGDTFDNRRNIDIQSLEWTKVNYFDKLQEMGITVHSVIGNHDIYYKDTNGVNSVDLLLREYSNIIVYGCVFNCFCIKEMKSSSIVYIVPEHLIRVSKIVYLSVIRTSMIMT